jgi:serine/threonine-protein kinase
MRDGTEVPGLSAGVRLGAYELLCTIGRGGFALVWLARLRKSRGFEKLVAIKTIRPELALDASFEKMFVDEARIAAGIEHPNVARVVDFGEERGILYLVMEYVAGDSLSAIARAASRHGAPMPVDVAVGIVAETCAGLHAAHELRVAGESLGVVHRDVSPQNILVSETGIPKLVDFGIAKAVDRLSADTAEGHQKGKLRYMAPEQVVPGRSIDRRVDVWAAGALLYELIEGRPIHPGPNDMARLHALVAGFPIAPLQREVSPEVEEVIRRALAHDPEERWSTAQAMREALVDALGTRRMIGSAAIEKYCAEVMPERRRDRERMVRQALIEADARDVEPIADSAPSRRDVSTAHALSLNDRHALTPADRQFPRTMRIGAAASACAALAGIALIVAARSKTPQSAVQAAFAGQTTATPLPSLPPEAPPVEVAADLAPAPPARAAQAAVPGPDTRGGPPTSRHVPASGASAHPRVIHPRPAPAPAPVAARATRSRPASRGDEDEIQ